MLPRSIQSGESPRCAGGSAQREDLRLNEFLASLAPTERERVRRQTEDIVSFLGRWAKPFGVFDPVRFHTTGLTMGAAATWCRRSQLHDMATITMWIFTIDECLDKGLFTPGERRHRIRNYVDVCARDDVKPLDPWAAALQDVTRRLSKRSIFPALRDEWATTCQLMLEGMAFECVCGEKKRRPSLATYMEHGLNSIGVPMYLTGAWITLDDPQILSHLPALRRIARNGGRAIRLANDLRSYDRERAEGNYNVLMLQTAAGMDLEAARAWALARSHECVRRVVRAHQRLGSVASRLASRVVQFSVDFYAEHDFHTVGRHEVHRV